MVTNDHSVVIRNYFCTADHVELAVKVLLKSRTQLITHTYFEVGQKVSRKNGNKFKS